MLTKPFFNLQKSRLSYRQYKKRLADLQVIPLPPQIKLLVQGSFNTPLSLKVGDAVKAGQKLSPSPENDNYAVSPASGVISSLTPFAGDYARNYTAVTIKTDNQESVDNAFAEQAATPSLALALEFLKGIPGAPPLDALSDNGTAIDTIVVSGLDTDLLVRTQQETVIRDPEALARGIGILREISGVNRIILALSRDGIQGLPEIEAELKIVSTDYPAGLPLCIMKDVLGRPVPAGKTCRDLGTLFFTAEAVASLGSAFESGMIPHTKRFTLINRDGICTLVSARIGTPLQSVFEAFEMTPRDNERLIIGGPMTGSAIYSTDFPILPDTDAVMLQDKKDIDYVSDYPCINCGECVRICPADIPVNMLIRFLEAGHYEEAAERYDLHSCLECGLCSFICVAKIPVFQYIRLAKHELAQIHLLESANE